MNAEDTARLLGNAQSTSTGWRCNCPAHCDTAASLHIRDTQDGQRIACCAAGCRQTDIAEAVRAREKHGAWIEDYERGERKHWTGGRYHA